MRRCLRCGCKTQHEEYMSMDIDLSNFIKPADYCLECLDRLSGLIWDAVKKFERKGE